MYVAARIFLLGMIDECVDVALERAIAARRVCVEATARLHCEVSGLLDRLHGEITGRLEDDCSLATHPRDDRGSVFVVVPPTGLTFLAAPSRAPPQRFLSPLLRLPFAASSMIEVISFDRTL